MHRLTIGSVKKDRANLLTFFDSPNDCLVIIHNAELSQVIGFDKTFSEVSLEMQISGPNRHPIPVETGTPFRSNPAP